MPTPEPPTVLVSRDLEDLSRAAAGALVEVAHSAIAERGAFFLALSGGSTPRGLYRLLASEYRDAPHWPTTHVFWSDERCVPPEHPDSNYRLAQGEMLSKVPVPASQVHRVRGEVEPARAAAEYAEAVRAAVPFGQGALPRFDLILLGLGADGHTASLFGKLADGDDVSLVTSVFAQHLGSHRITFTPRLLNAAAHVFFLVSGKEKAPAVAAVLAGGSGLPAEVVRPSAGRLVWFLDEAAALEQRNLQGKSS